MTLKFKGARVRRVSWSRPPSTREVMIKSPEDTPGLINGMQAESSYEWNIARALWALGWQFEYQVPMFGGRMVRGGVVLDFLVPTRPMQTVVSVIGEYWHRDTDADVIEDLKIMERLGQGTRILRPGTAESARYEDALAYCHKEIGRA